MIHTDTLSNGLRIIHREAPSEISHCGIVVNTGSRDEYPGEAGMAHFVEHMLFKGTENRSAEDIAQEIDSIGGHLDAFTSKEYAGYYIKVLDEHLPKAVDLLADIVRRPRFAARRRGALSALAARPIISSACARVSAVISTPPSILESSSTRSSRDRRRTVVRLVLPSVTFAT